MSANSTDWRDFRGMDAVRPVTAGSAELWDSERAACKDGRIARVACIHPVQAVEQFYDDARTHGELNLFKCLACSRLLRLFDGHGGPAADGTDMVTIPGVI